MKNIRYIDKKDVENLIESKTSDDVIIFLSGPTSQKTPLSVLQTRGNDSNLLIVFYVQIMPDDFVMQLHRF
ncbi:lipopolysaccharide core biosynthesis protein [Escherichia coli]|nr:lipopolysaccharide core biosynthesis protein [Escherichia coli]SQZ14731.1 lipopolysaccharide core biosynthesis protein [Escherichia coli]